MGGFVPYHGAELRELLSTHRASAEIRAVSRRVLDDAVAAYFKDYMPEGYRTRVFHEAVETPDGWVALLERNSTCE